MSRAGSKKGTNPSLVGDLLIILVLAKAIVDIAGYSGLGAIAVALMLIVLALLVALRNPMLDSFLRGALAVAALIAWFISLYYYEPAIATAFALVVLLLYGIYWMFRSVGIVR